MAPLRVYDLLGRPVRTLWDGLLPAGAHQPGQAVTQGEARGWMAGANPLVGKEKGEKVISLFAE